MRLQPGEFDGAERFGSQRQGGGFAVFPQRVVFAGSELVFHARIANHDGFPRHRRVVHALEPAINVHHVMRFAEQAGELVQQSAVDTDELDFGRLTKYGQVQFLFRVHRRQSSSQQ